MNEATSDNDCFLSVSSLCVSYPGYLRMFSKAMAAVVARTFAPSEKIVRFPGSRYAQLRRDPVNLAMSCLHVDRRATGRDHAVQFSNQPVWAIRTPSSDPESLS